MWIETDGGEGPVLGLHLGMAGRIVVDDAVEGDYWASGDNGKPVWDRFVLEFEDGGRLVLRDRRRLGRAILDPAIDQLGPDAAEISREAFRERVGFGTAPLKARIMDQAVIAGVGNLLADEALWQAELSPVRPAGQLSEAELDRLRVALRAAIRRAIRLGGVHTGEFIEHRQRGGHCPRCGTELLRATVGGRTTYWCPKEQL
jgi:formamidopyrimidine-DNA glycosylase